MYHINKLNQVLFRKNLSPASLAPKDLQTDYRRCDDSYLSTLTKYQKKIANYVLPFRNKPRIILKNETIALAIGCSTKTVTRATNKFLKDGFITKNQQNKYAPNNYSIKNIKLSFSHWFQSLSLSNQNLYDSHGIRIDHNNKIIYSYRNVPQTKSSLIFSSLSRRNVLVSSRGSAVRKVHAHDKKNQKKGRKVNSVQKQLILDNRNDPRVKDMLKNPEIMAHIITPTIQKITTLLTLDEKEQFKLTAFTDETVYHIYEKAYGAIAHNKAPHITNRMKWLLAFATKYCEDNNLEPDWKWYYDLCDIIGIEPKTETKPLITQQPKQRKGGIYKPWKSPEPVLTASQKYDNLVKEIEICKKALADPFTHFKFCVSESIKRTENRMNQCLKELSELEAEEPQKKEREHEKQNVLYQYVPDSMEACSA